MSLSRTSGWVFNPNTFRWFPDYVTAPVPRLQHAMAFDSRRGRVVVFGGRSFDPAGFDTFLNDTWERDGLRW